MNQFPPNLGCGGVMWVHDYISVVYVKVKHIFYKLLLMSMLPFLNAVVIVKANMPDL